MLFTFFLLLHLIGCSSTKKTYWHFPDGVSKQQFYGDKVACQQLATYRETAFVNGIGSSQARVNYEMMNNCMFSKGYTLSYSPTK